MKAENSPPHQTGHENATASSPPLHGESNSSSARSLLVAPPVNLHELMKKCIQNDVIGAVKQKLTPASSRTASASTPSQEPMFVFIVDQKTLKTVSCCVRQFELLQWGVTVVDSLSKTRQPLPTVHAIYLLSSSKASVDGVLKDFDFLATPKVDMPVQPTTVAFSKDKSKKKAGNEPVKVEPIVAKPVLGNLNMYASFHVFFTSSLPPTLFAQLKGSTNFKRKINTLCELGLDFATYSSSVFHSDLPSAVTDLFVPQRAKKPASRPDDIPTELCRMHASSLASVLTQSKARVGQIGYAGTYASSIAQSVANTLKAQANTITVPKRAASSSVPPSRESSMTSKGETKSVQDQAGTAPGLGPQSALDPTQAETFVYIFDRAVDPFAPLIHDLRYECMATDVLCSDLRDADKASLSHQSKTGDSGKASSSGKPSSGAPSKSGSVLGSSWPMFAEEVWTSREQAAQGSTGSSAALGAAYSSGPGAVPTSSRSSMRLFSSSANLGKPQTGIPGGGSSSAGLTSSGSCVVPGWLSLPASGSTLPALRQETSGKVESSTKNEATSTKNEANNAKTSSGPMQIEIKVLGGYGAEDEFWARNSARHVADVQSTLQTELKDFTENHAIARIQGKAAAGNIAAGGIGGAGGLGGGAGHLQSGGTKTASHAGQVLAQMDVSEAILLARSLPDYQNTFRMYDLHGDCLKRINAALFTDKLMEVIGFEMELATGLDENGKQDSFSKVYDKAQAIFSAQGIVTDAVTRMRVLLMLVAAYRPPEPLVEHMAKSLLVPSSGGLGSSGEAMQILRSDGRGVVSKISVSNCQDAFLKFAKFSSLVAREPKPEAEGKSSGKQDSKQDGKSGKQGDRSGKDKKDEKSSKSKDSKSKDRPSSASKSSSGSRSSSEPPAPPPSASSVQLYHCSLINRNLVKAYKEKAKSCKFQNDRYVGRVKFLLERVLTGEDTSASANQGDTSTTLAVTGHYPDEYESIKYISVGLSSTAPAQKSTRSLASIFFRKVARDGGEAKSASDSIFKQVKQNLFSLRSAVTSTHDTAEKGATEKASLAHRFQGCRSRASMWGVKQLQAKGMHHPRRNPLIVVYIVGGVAVSEILELQELASNYEIDLLIGGSCVLTPPRFIQALLR